MSNQKVVHIIFGFNNCNNTNKAIKYGMYVKGKEVKAYLNQRDAWDVSTLDTTSPTAKLILTHVQDAMADTQSAPCCHACWCSFTWDSGWFGRHHGHGVDEGKFLSFFLGMHSWSFSFSLMKVKQFLSAAPCPFALSPVQLVYLKSPVSVAMHSIVW